MGRVEDKKRLPYGLGLCETQPLVGLCFDFVACCWASFALNCVFVT